MIQRFKLSISSLFILMLLTALTNQAFSQSFTTPIGWHHTVYEARTEALGQSTAALDNGTAYHMNPAIPSEPGVLQASSFLFSTTAFGGSDFKADLYSPSISFSTGKLSYSAMLDYTTFTTPSEFGNEGGTYSNQLLRFRAGYSITKNLSVGAGFLYSNYQSPVFEINNMELGGDASAWGIDAGLFYQKQLESDNFFWEPQTGLSLNTIGPGFDYELSSMRDDNLPGQIKLGLGVDMTSKRLAYDKPLYGIGIYTGFSKYLARLELDEDGTVLSRQGGFEALFTTWNSFERYTGSEYRLITLGEQISASVGIELQFLESLSLRYGLTGGADEWIRPQHGLGAELDLYYISFAVSHTNYHSSDRWGPQGNLTRAQVTFRIPIDGQSRDTLIDRFF